MSADDLLPYGGRSVRLRDVTLDDADLIDRWNMEMEPGNFNDFGRREPIPREALLAGRPLRGDNGGMLIIERVDDGEPVGVISYRAVAYGPPPDSLAWQLGIDLPIEARGQGYGSQAQRLLADWLFATTSVNRVEAGTDSDNVPEQRSLEKAGFVREGVLRGAQFRAGAYHDLVYYSRLRSDR